LSKAEISFGNIGPSLYNYGKLRGNSEQTLRYTWAKIWNTHAYNACSSMPRFGDAGILTEAQIKDVMALLDPNSPVNKEPKMTAGRIGVSPNACAPRPTRCAWLLRPSWRYRPGAGGRALERHQLIDSRVLPAGSSGQAVSSQIWASWCPFCGAEPASKTHPNGRTRPRGASRSTGPAAALRTARLCLSGGVRPPAQHV
jgi:sulfur oxidation c-type cytochrome SoxX